LAQALQITFSIMENHSTENIRETLVNDVNALKRDVAQLAEDMKSHAQTYVTTTKQRIQEKVESAQDALSSRPLAVLTAVFVLGFLCGLRSRK
jgi:ElaB/YqjD/DUF883 family membrane-anchored ribosome-binding protein